MQHTSIGVSTGVALASLLAVGAIANVSAGVAVATLRMSVTVVEACSVTAKIAELDNRITDRVRIVITPTCGNVGYTPSRVALGVGAAVDRVQIFKRNSSSVNKIGIASAIACTLDTGAAVTHCGADTLAALAIPGGHAVAANTRDGYVTVTLYF